MDETNQRRSAAVVVGVVALTLGGFAVAGSRADDRGVCVDRTTNVRMDDDSCDDDQNSSYSGGAVHGWYYIPSGRSAPPVGQPIDGQGSFNPPRDGSFTRGGVAADGGKVTRGGFLSSHSTFGG